MRRYHRSTLQSIVVYLIDHSNQRRAASFERKASGLRPDDMSYKDRPREQVIRMKGGGGAPRKTRKNPQGPRRKARRGALGYKGATAAKMRGSGAEGYA